MLLKIDVVKPNNEKTLKIKPFPLKPLMGIVKNFILLGTTLFSMPVFVPIQITSWLLLIHSLPNSNAGKTWPPVPAAEIKNFITL